MLNLCLVGGLGRMGRAIASLVSREEDITIVSVWEAPQAMSDTPDYGVATGYSKNSVNLSSDGPSAVKVCDVVVDFASGAVFDKVIEVCRDLSKPLVTGTTAIVDKEAKLGTLAGEVAVVSAPNMAVGVNLVFGICETLGKAMGQAADIEIVEAHHRTKKDVPSGTALEIAKILSKSTGKPVAVGRERGSSERADEIMIHSLRVGDVAGKHTVVFSPKGETLEITHTAQSRDCFGAGALRAARFAAAAPPGLYNMLDVLNLI